MRRKATLHAHASFEIGKIKLGTLYIVPEFVPYLKAKKRLNGPAMIIHDLLNV